MLAHPPIQLGRAPERRIMECSADGCVYTSHKRVGYGKYNTTMVREREKLNMRERHDRYEFMRERKKNGE